MGWSRKALRDEIEGLKQELDNALRQKEEREGVLNSLMEVLGIAGPYKVSTRNPSFMATKTASVNYYLVRRDVNAILSEQDARECRKRLGLA